MQKFYGKGGAQIVVDHKYSMSQQCHALVEETAPWDL